jgi:hypothetical protein
MSHKPIPEELSRLGFRSAEAHINQWYARKVIYKDREGDETAVILWLDYNHNIPGGLIYLQVESADYDFTATIGWSSDLTKLLPLAVTLIKVCETAPHDERSE